MTIVRGNQAALLPTSNGNAIDCTVGRGTASVGMACTLRGLSGYPLAHSVDASIGDKNQLYVGRVGGATLIERSGPVRAPVFGRFRSAASGQFSLVPGRVYGFAGTSAACTVGTSAAGRRSLTCLTVDAHLKPIPLGVGFRVSSVSVQVLSIRASGATKVVATFLQHV